MNGRSSRGAQGLPSYFGYKRNCAVPENIHTPPTEGLKFPGGGGFCKAKTFKEMYKA